MAQVTMLTDRPATVRPNAYPVEVSVRPSRSGAGYGAGWGKLECDLPTGAARIAESDSLEKTLYTVLDEQARLA